MTDVPIQKHWLETFVKLFTLCKINPKETVAVLTETQSRPINIKIAQQALKQMKIPFKTVCVTSKQSKCSPIIRSTGATNALVGENLVTNKLKNADMIVDLTVEGLMHAPQTPSILAAGSRIMNISNEHPDILSRLPFDLKLKQTVKDAVKMCRSSNYMHITSDAGSDLSVRMNDAVTVGVWGWTDRPGTLAHWPGGLVVSFPNTGATNGRLVFKPGDINLTFKRYFESEVICKVEDDFIVHIEGDGTDARLMRTYLEGFNDPLAYATSHVGWGLNKASRYESLSMYEKNDLNGTELRALAGNFLYSTGANEFCNRFTEGHFDLPMMDCTIELDGVAVVDEGNLV